MPTTKLREPTYAQADLAKEFGCNTTTVADMARMTGDHPGPEKNGRPKRYTMAAAKRLAQVVDFAKAMKSKKGAVS